MSFDAATAVVSFSFMPTLYNSARTPRKPWRFPLLAIVTVACLAPLRAAEPPEKQAAQSAPAAATPYEPGMRVSFGQGGASETYRRSGWSETETKFTWTTGQSAKLLFGLPNVDYPLKLRMRIGGFISPPKLTVQPVEIFANGKKIADWQVVQPKELMAFIPANLVADRAELTIEIRTPKAASPQSLGVSTDSRVLGVNCFELSITKSDE